jgi:serine/threonine protein kinase/Tfp pilus assembly protein PilF
MDAAGEHREAVRIAREIARRPARERPAALQSHCGHDPHLRQTVEHLLSQEDARTHAPHDPLDSADQNDVATILPGHDMFEPVARSATSADAAATPPSTPTTPTSAGAFTGRRIGAYTILDLLGEGGMGAVYLAEQSRPKRVVALKLVRPGLMTPRMLRRFEHESEMLARLQHPGIAQIYEAGTADDGQGHRQPYFAMEYVRGSTLTGFASEHRLTARQRIDLFTKICDAVQHAHQKGVIHRDLKPGNILVQVPEGTATERIASVAQPKILDFGIARSTESDAASGATYQTEVGQLIGTIPYMSPEQIGASTGGVDTRSDVYTLGVILYELLAGRLPHTLNDKTIPEAVRTVCEEEPKPLSEVDRTLHGDIQTIVRKALEKDRSRRYQSASELSQDLRRYLNNEPILAQPPSRAYLLKKFAARNRAVVVGASLAVLALVGAVIGVSIQAARAENARAIAREEADFAKAANEFLVSMLSAANPDQNNDRELTVREMLDRAAERLDKDEAEDQANQRVAMSMHSTLASTYRALGKPGPSLEQAERALALAKQLRGHSNPETIDAQRTLAMSLAESNRLEESERMTRDAIEQLEKLYGPEHADISRAKAELGRVLMERGEFVEAERELREGLTGLRTKAGDRDPDTVIAMDHLGLALQRLGRFDEAEEVEREGLRLREKINGPESTITAFSLNNLANIVQRRGRHQEAIDLLERTLNIRKKKLDPDHPSLLVTMTNLAVAYIGAGRLAEGERLMNESLGLHLKYMGEEHPKTLSTMGNLAYVYEDEGKLDEAEAMFRRVIEIKKRSGPITDQDGWGHMNNLAMLLIKRSRTNEAEPIFRELLALCEQKLPPEHYLIAIFRNNYGACLTQLGRYADAERELLESQKSIEAFFKPTHDRAKKGRQRLMTLYQAWGKPERAAEYSDSLGTK